MHSSAKEKDRGREGKSSHICSMYTPLGRRASAHLEGGDGQAWELLLVGHRYYHHSRSQVVEIGISVKVADQVVGRMLVLQLRTAVYQYQAVYRSPAVFVNLVGSAFQ